MVWGNLGAHALRTIYNPWISVSLRERVLALQQSKPKSHCIESFSYDFHIYITGIVFESGTESPEAPVLPLETINRSLN